MECLEWAQFFPHPREKIYETFSDVRNLNLFLPPFASLELHSPAHVALVPGTLFDYDLRLHGIPVAWRTLVEEVEEGRRFVDSQVWGPYRHFRHTHEFYEVEGGTVMVDRVEYAVPGGPLAGLVNALYVRGALQTIFNHRKQASAKILWESRV